MDCKHCGQEFTPVRKGVVYCSNSCRQGAFRNRREASHLAMTTKIDLKDCNDLIGGDERLQLVLAINGNVQVSQEGDALGGCADGQFYGHSSQGCVMDGVTVLLEGCKMTVMSRIGGLTVAQPHHNGPVVLEFTDHSGQADPSGWLAADVRAAFRNLGAMLLAMTAPPECGKPVAVSAVVDPLVEHHSQA